MPKALSTLAVGNKVEIPVNSAFQSRFGSKIVFKVADKNHTGYPSGAVTLITDKIIQLMCSDAIEASNSDSNRKQYGNNRHIHSNILQWLNSNAAAGAWYSAKHSADAPPTNANVYQNYNEYDQWAGFLAMLPAQFVDALMTTTLSVVKATVDGGSYETFTAKMFLPSTTEVGLANENSIAEGVKLALFSDDASRLAYPTSECVSNSEYTNASLNTTAAWYWWLRTPNVSNSCNVRSVITSGALINYSAYYGVRGVRPLCNLSSEILVSDSVNSDGNYEIIFNSAPSAPAGITTPSTCYSSQPINISWGAATDPDGDAITYKLERSVNNGSYTQATSTAGLTFSETVSTAWNTIKYRVKAVDSYGNESAYVTGGAVAVIHNQPPAISGTNGDLGVKSGDFGYAYTVTDPDGDAVTAVEAVGDNTIRTFTPPLGVEQTANVAGVDFVKLANGQHSLKITATDSAGNTASRTMTFTKQVDGFTIGLSQPFNADAQPKRVNVIVHRQIPAGATFRVEVSNNPFDTSPVWEDMTTKVLQGTAHVFENTSQYAINSGLGLRITVARNGAVGECWVSGVGGNFE
ncbi:MAG: DUF6273 domain-containing protein [Christensenellaceae bacterium]|jgi:hypothetical protein|nr:DUF6273 domain-containing protein [Christensenellaceae bacterium]